MTKALIAAVHSVLENDSALKSVAPGGVHTGRAPAGTAMPFVVIHHDGAAAIERDTGGKAVLRETMIFETFAAGAETAADAVERLSAIFEGSPPALETGACLAAAAVAETLRIETGAGPEGRDIWCGTVRMEFMVERPPV